MLLTRAPRRAPKQRSAQATRTPPGTFLAPIVHSPGLDGLRPSPYWR